MEMTSETNEYPPLLIGVDISNKKDVPVLAVFTRTKDGGYILKKEFTGDAAIDVYTRLTTKEDD